jgi:type I restriction enzyme S subunit
MKLKTIKLKDLCEVFDDGNWIESKDQSVDGIRLIQTGNIKNGVFANREDKSRYISEKTFKKLNCKEILAGDILVSRLPEPVGRSCIIPKLAKKAITAVDCTIIRPKKICLTEYLNYYMQSPQYFLDVKKKVSGATRQRISRKNLGEILIPIPEISEQKLFIKKIKTIFADIDSNISIKKKNYEELNSLKISILKKMFKDGQKIKLGDLYEITSSKRVFKSEWKENGVPFYRAREIVKLAKKENFKNPIYISQKMYDLYSKKYGSPKEGDILITGVGTLGITYLVKKDDRFYFKDGNIIWLKKKQSNINSAYIEFIFKSPFVKAQITNSIGATVGTLTIQKAKELLIPYPSPDTQNEIMKKINNIFISLNNYEDNLKKIINNYYALKNNLIKYFLIDKSV